MDSQQSNGMGGAYVMSPSPRSNSEFTFPSSSDVGISSVDKRQNRGRLCALLTQPPNPDYSFSRSSSVESLKDDRKDLSNLKSPSDSTNQSPTPGPGQSPPDRPQSSTHGDDGDGAPAKKSNNIILKQLLSQEEEETNREDNDNILRLLGSDGESVSGEAIAKDDDASSLNEAEAKDSNKKPNILLKVW